jgi:hypothetical protein
MDWTSGESGAETEVEEEWEDGWGERRKEG